MSRDRGQWCVGNMWNFNVTNSAVCDFIRGLIVFLDRIVSSLFCS